jgi:hypothetical protein
MEKCSISSAIEKLAVYDQPNRTVVEKKHRCTYIYICAPRNEIRVVLAAIRRTVKLYSLYKRKFFTAWWVHNHEILVEDFLL